LPVFLEMEKDSGRGHRVTYRLRDSSKRRT
jgi:hypothetical protein